MNKTIRKFLLVSAFIVQAGSFKIFAQAPNQFSYQAVIRDANGKIVESKPVNIRISILQGSTTGNSIFLEEHTDSTNVNGLVSLQIGSKANFNIDWSQGPFFIKTELKNVGEANYVDYGTTQMLSVPYALYAEKSGSSSVPGPKGDKGDKGDTGDQGIPGKDGVDGKNGLDGKDGLPGAQGPKGDKGDKGDQGPIGLTGPKGDTGSQGLPGKDGVDGKNGLDGKDGLPGAQGPKGDKGDKGDQGPIGLTGPKGDTGAQGIPGKDGKVEFQNLKVSISGDTLYLTNGNFVIIPGLSAANPKTKPTSGYGPNITDVDGNSYKTVYIGTQQWMGENLKTSKYNDGTPIPNVTDNMQWPNLTSGAWCNYDNKDSLGNIYGKLYNWYVVSPTTNGNKNVCPLGWHVPTDTEWTVLSDYLGGESIAGGKMKEVGISKWLSPNTDATNTSFFSGLPGGHRGYFGSFDNSGFITGYWWSSTLDYSGYAFRRFLSYSNGSFGKSNDPIIGGLSIRCLKDADNSTNPPIQGSIQTIDCGGATNNGTLTANTAVSGVSSVIAYTGGNGGTYTSQAIASSGVTGLTATLSAGSFANGNGTLTYNITGTPSSSGTATFGINISGKTCVLSRTIEQPTSGYGPNITDIEGNSYKTVYIGTQHWMGENLKTSKYNDGTVIHNEINNRYWSKLTTAAWAHYNNDVANNSIYGKLYNWYAVSPTTNDNKNVCPTGWHVPTDAEWTLLINYVGGANDAGGKLKEVGTTNWISPNTDATNTSLFSALPGGFLDGNGDNVNIGSAGIWWSSTESDAANAWGRHVLNSSGIAFRNNSHVKVAGFSVRCLKD